MSDIGQNNNLRKNGLPLKGWMQEAQRDHIMNRNSISTDGSFQAGLSAGKINIPNFIPTFVLGKIMDEGPAAEADYTDNRYWVKSVYVSNNTDSEVNAVTYAEYNASSDGYWYVTAQSLATINIQDHSIPVDSIVLLMGVNNIDSPPIKRWLIVGGHLGLAEC